jgi:hypothetical protein
MLPFPRIHMLRTGIGTGRQDHCVRMDERRRYERAYESATDAYQVFRGMLTAQ